MDLPFSEGNWEPHDFAGLTGRACQTADLIILGSVLFGLVVAPFFAQSHLTFFSFLGLRISLRNALIAVFCLSAWRSVLWTAGLYSGARIRTLGNYFARMVFALILSALIALVVLGVVRQVTRPVRATLLYFLLTGLAMAASRFVLLVSWHKVRPMFRQTRNLIIVGSRERARRVYQDLKAHTEWDYNLVGFVDEVTDEIAIPREMILGSPKDLETILMRTVVDEVVIALPMKSQWEIIDAAIATCQRLGVQSQYFTDQFGTSVTKRRVAAGEGTGRIVLAVVHNDYRLRLKRAIDIFGSLFGVVLLSPIFIVTALAVKLTSKGPMFFKQERFGLNKRTFGMLKFRSMVVDAEAKQAALEHLNETSGPAFKIKNDPRITPIGKFIRKYSIDELPQLLNVLLGDMSLVGPRPLPSRDVGKFSEAWLMRRFSVKPGLTCIWQVSGRSNTDFDRWIELDLQYIDNWSLWLDTFILFKTVPAVLKGRGAS